MKYVLIFAMLVSVLFSKEIPREEYLKYIQEKDKEMLIKAGLHDYMKPCKGRGFTLSSKRKIPNSDGYAQFKICNEE